MTMGVLSDLEPKRVFHYFEEITKIPHGSGNVRAISDYLVNFAKEHKLSYIQDEFLNVIIFKDASIGYENEPTLMLQGHMDMVAVHTDDYDADMKKTPLEAAVDGDYIYANSLTEANLMVAANLGFLPTASKIKEKISDESITSLPLLKNNEIVKTKLYGFYKKSFDDNLYKKLILVLKDVMK